MLYPGIRLPRNGSLKITDFDTLPHLFQSLGHFLHQVHLDVEIDGKVGILVRRIDGLAHIEIDIGGFLKQQAADEGRAVLNSMQASNKHILLGSKCWQGGFN